MSVVRKRRIFTTFFVYYALCVVSAVADFADYEPRSAFTFYISKETADSSAVVYGRLLRTMHKSLICQKNRLIKYCGGV